MTEPVRVWMSECRCPGTPHPDGDFAYLRPYLLYEGGAAALRAMGQAAGDPTRFGELVGPIYIRHGLVAWDRLDENGEPVPIDEESITALRWEDAYELADKADDLYGETVLLPLARRTVKSSPGGLTVASTSRNSRSRRRPQMPSEPS